MGTFRAQNKNELRKLLLSKKVKEGWYTAYTDSGQMVRLNVTRKSEAIADKRVSKEVYDTYYWCINDAVYCRAIEEGTSPSKFKWSKRFPTLDEIRRYALTMSYKEFKEYEMMSRFGYPVKMGSIVIHIFKEDRYLGAVEYEMLHSKDGRMFPMYGYWYPVNSPKDPVPLKKDGTVYR